MLTARTVWRGLTVRHMSDESDFDFGEQGLQVSDTLMRASSAAHDEAEATRELASVVDRLRVLLMQHPADPNDSRHIDAVGLVHASLANDNDEFYKSETWQRCKRSHFSVQGTSFQTLLQEARTCLVHLES